MRPVARRLRATAAACTRPEKLLVLLEEQTMTFDRLVYIDRLKDAGIDEATARAHAEALREAKLFD